MSNWLDEAQYLFKTSSVWVQLAVMSVNLLVKYAPPLFKLVSEGVDEVFDIIDEYKAAKKPKNEISGMKYVGREELVAKIKSIHPEYPETRIRGAIEDMVDVKKVVRYGVDVGKEKEARAIKEATINIGEINRAKEAYPALFGMR